MAISMRYGLYRNINVVCVYLFLCVLPETIIKFGVNRTSDAAKIHNYFDSYSSSARQENIIDDGVISSIYTYDNITSGYYRLKKQKRQKVRKKTLQSPEALRDLADDATVDNEDGETYYMGYAKNPFGGSVRWNNFRTTNLSGYDAHSLRLAVSNLDEDHRISEGREKRGVTHLYNMVSCATGCNPLYYKGYGCYCGFLGSGRTTDRIDRCCMIHDICYETVNCPMFLVYFVPYLWKCWRGRPLCAVDHLGYGSSGSCAARLCECDRALALCLSRSPCPSRRAICTSSPWRLLQNLALFY